MTRMKHETRAFLVLFAVLFSLMLFFTTSPAHAQTSSIEMTTEKTKISFWLSGEGEAVIDWGAGTPQTVTLDVERPYSSPEGLPGGPKTIRVTVRNGSIWELECHNSGLTSLDVSRTPGLRKLTCYNNNLSSLDVSRNTALMEVNCAVNKLTSLDLSRNLKLTYVGCSYNELSTDALNALFGTLHDNNIEGVGESIYFDNNPGSDSADKSIVPDNWIRVIGRE